MTYLHRVAAMFQLIPDSPESAYAVLTYCRLVKACPPRTPVSRVQILPVDHPVYSLFTSFEYMFRVIVEVSFLDMINATDEGYSVVFV